MSQRLVCRLKSSASSRQGAWICHQCRRYSDAATPAPPLLLKLRNDLKSAMKAKDTARLSVLRSILAEVTNADKTPNGAIKTDMQLLSLLRKRTAAAKSASDEFRSAGRQDLVDKEEQQTRVLEEYAGGVELMSDEAIRNAVVGCVEDVKKEQKGGRVPMGEVMKRLLAPQGVLHGQNVEKTVLSRIVKEVTAS